MTRAPGGGGAKAQLTHFLCLPLITKESRPQLEATLQVFKNDVNSVVPEKAIRSVDTLHLTLGVMALTQQKLKLAVNALQSLDIASMLQNAAASSITNAEASTNLEPLSITLRGLQPMHAPASTSILYIAPYDSTSRLQPFCSAIQRHFRDQGLFAPDDRPLRLHATVVNTIYARGARKAKPSRSEAEQVRTDTQDMSAMSSSTADGSSEVVADEGASVRRSRAKDRLRIDARKTIDKYAAFQWSDSFALDRIAICEMGAKKEYDELGKLITERYKEVAHTDLPRSCSEDERWSGECQ